MVTTNIDITVCPTTQYDNKLLLSQVPDQSLQADITGLSPATNYSLAVTAHTNYGSHTGPVSYALTLDDGKFDVNIN